MEVIIQLGTRSYPVVIDKGIASELPSYLKMAFPESRRWALVTNTTLASIYADLIQSWNDRLGLVVHTVPDGEKYKTIETWSGILDTLLAARLDRSCGVIAFGGGVVGDMTGFAAAAFLRGVEYIQVPTTLLAMVDSSVGGKTAVDHPQGKNLIGAFHQPRLVWIETDFLDSLPQRDFQSGYAEVFKNAFIGGPDMFAFIENNHGRMLQRDFDILREGITRSVKIKAYIVEQDERESGMRALLNFGHTFGHSLERFFGYEGILHGEGVFWGMLCACELGKRAGTIPESTQSQYDAILKKVPRSQLPHAPNLNKIYNGMFHDKKVASGKIHFVLPAQPGYSIVKSDIDEAMVRETMEVVFSGKL